MKMKFREYNRESSDEKSKVCPKFIGNKVDTRYGRNTLRRNEFILTSMTCCC